MLPHVNLIANPIDIWIWVLILIHDLFPINFQPIPMKCRVIDDFMALKLT